MPDAIKDVKQAIGELGMAEPVVWLGRKMAEGGRAISDGVDRATAAVKRVVTPEKPKSKDIVLPRSGIRRRSTSRRMSR